MAKHVAAPECLRQPLEVPRRHLLGAGPTNSSPRVLRALGQPTVFVVTDDCYKIMDEVVVGLRYVLQTTNPVTFPVSGSGSAATETALSNLIERDDVVMIGVNGTWSVRAADMAERYGAKVIRLEKAAGQDYSLEEVEAALQKYKPKLFLLVHGESSTGVLQKLEGFGPLCHKYDCLILVDAVITCGGVPLYTDLWDLDVVFTGSQKCLGIPPGISAITFSPKAVQVMKARKTKPMVFYFDALAQAGYWNCFGQGKSGRKYHHTISTTFLYGLREGLAEIVEEGLENRWKRHQVTAELFYKGLQDHGIELFVEEEEKRLPLVVTIKASPDIDWTEVYEYCRIRHNVVFAPGVGLTAGLVFRIGLIGVNACQEKVELALKVLADGMKHAKINTTNGY